MLNKSISYFSHLDLSSAILANDSISPNIDIRFISSSHVFYLKSILYISNFSFNLISISKLTQSLQAIITFFLYSYLI